MDPNHGPYRVPTGGGDGPSHSYCCLLARIWARVVQQLSVDNHVLADRVAPFTYACALTCPARMRACLERAGGGLQAVVRSIIELFRPHPAAATAWFRLSTQRLLSLRKACSGVRRVWRAVPSWGSMASVAYRHTKTT